MKAHLLALYKLSIRHKCIMHVDVAELDITRAYNHFQATNFLTTFSFFHIRLKFQIFCGKCSQFENFLNYYMALPTLTLINRDGTSEFFSKSSFAFMHNLLAMVKARVPYRWHKHHVFFCHSWGRKCIFGAFPRLLNEKNLKNVFILLSLISETLVASLCSPNLGLPTV